VERGDGELEFLLDLGRGKRLEGLEGFAGCGINCGNGHEEIVLRPLHVVLRSLQKFGSPIICLEAE